MQVTVDKGKCIGCGACVALCPEVFEMTEIGKANIKDAEACEECDCRSAAQNCPVSAISFSDDSEDTSTELEDTTDITEEPILDDGSEEEDY